MMGRHAFREAHAVMSRVDSLDPGVPSHVALLGDIELELGDYDAAAKRFSSIQYDGRNFTIGARLARWHEITGHSDRARAFLVESIKRVRLRDDLPREQVAWFYFRLGDLEMRAGNAAAADSAFNAALAVNPDPRALSELAHIAYRKSDFRRAAELGERVIESHRDPELLAVLTSSYCNLGDSAKAALYARATTEKLKVEPGVIHRPWGLFILDYGTTGQKAHVLELARQERETRNDVYAHDLLAWALFRTGHAGEARAEMRLALSHNTQDVMLSDHAQAIGVGSQARPKQPVILAPDMPFQRGRSSKN
jgi:tetratricopeptide (TPR) repeat protein